MVSLRLCSTKVIIQSPIFVHLFQKSLDTGEIPKELVLANICPLYKKGDRALACNYRPVSLTLCTF